MSNGQKIVIKSGTDIPTTEPATAAPSSAPAKLKTSPKAVVSEGSIGVRELKNNLTRIVTSVRNEQKEYIVTVHGQPVAVLRPYTEDDARTAWEQAADQEIADMLEAAARISAAWKSEKLAQRSSKRCGKNQHVSNRCKCLYRHKQEK